MGELIVLLLYSSLPPNQQSRIFEPAPPARGNGPPGRKIVVSTNIAGASLTIDEIAYVIDPGFSNKRFTILELVWNRFKSVLFLLKLVLSKEVVELVELDLENVINYTLKNYFVLDGGLKKWFVKKNPVEFTKYTYMEYYEMRRSFKEE
jgi:hypothetical protein